MTTPDDLPLLVINLARSPGRMAQFLADNAQPGLAITRVEAIDGQTMDRAALIGAGLVAPDLRHANNVVGCSLSHVACWRIVAQGTRPVVVCEDDAVLRHDFPALHRHLHGAIAHADIVFWSFNLDMHVGFEAPGLGEATLIFNDTMLTSEDSIRAFQAQQSATVLYPLRRAWGLATYTITPHGARRLLDLVLPLRDASGDICYPTGDGRMWQMHYDSWGIDMAVGLFHARAINGLVAIPPVALGRNNKADSSIDAGGRRFEPLAADAVPSAAGEQR